MECKVEWCKKDVRPQSTTCCKQHGNLIKAQRKRERYANDKEYRERVQKQALEYYHDVGKEKRRKRA